MINNIIFLILGILGGTAIGRYLLTLVFKGQEQQAKNKAKNILKEAESKADILKKDKILEAKERFLQLKADHEQELQQKNQQAGQRENTLKQKEQSLNQKIENNTRKEVELESTKVNLTKQLEIVETKKQEIEEVKNQHLSKLETIAGLSVEDAKNELVEALKEEAKTLAMSSVKDAIEEARDRKSVV